MNVLSASDRADASACSAGRGPSVRARRASERADGGSGPISTGSTSGQCSTSGATSFLYAVSVHAEAVGGRVEVALEQDRGAVVERMRSLCVRLDPLDVEVERAEERRVRAERVDRGADVVHEPGQGQLERADAAAESLVRLVDVDVEPRARQLERAGEAVRARADDDRPHRRLRSAGPSDWPPRSTGS